MSSVALSVRLRVLLVCAHRLSCAALDNLLAADPDCTIVGKATDLAEVQPLLYSGEPDLLLADLDGPTGLDLPFLGQLTAMATAIPIVLVTAHAEPALLYQLLAFKLQAILTKDMDAPTFIGTIKLLKERGGQIILSPTLVQQLERDHAPPPAAPASLTKREQQVLALVLQGQSNGAIAAQLHLSRQTVRNYVHVLYQKFQVSTRVELLLLLTKR